MGIGAYCNVNNRGIQLKLKSDGNWGNKLIISSPWWRNDLFNSPVFLYHYSVVFVLRKLPSLWPVSYTRSYYGSHFPTDALPCWSGPGEVARSQHLRTSRGPWGRARVTMRLWHQRSCFYTWTLISNWQNTEWSDKYYYSIISEIVKWLVNYLRLERRRFWGNHGQGVSDQFPAHCDRSRSLHVLIIIIRFLAGL